MTISPASVSLTDLVRFLIARIDEEDQDVSRIRRARAHPVGGASPAEDDPAELDHRQAETEAKRRVIAVAQQLLVLRDLPNEQPVREAAAQILRAMAEPYHEHASYRPEWHRHR